MKIIRPTEVSGQATTSLEDRRYPHVSAGTSTEISMCNPDCQTIQEQLNERAKITPEKQVQVNPVRTEVCVKAEQ